MERYGAMLQAFHQIIAPVEPRLCELLGEVFIPPPPRSRAERIRADLKALNREIVPVAADDRLVVGSPAEAYGVAYVLQGSLLGGAVIARQMGADCRDRPIPTSYLELYGDGLRDAWTRFCQAANSFGRAVGEDERRHVTNAAIGTFRAFDRAFDRMA